MSGDIGEMRKEVIGNATLYLGDCLGILPSECFDGAVITDPPYSSRTHSGHAKGVSGHLGAGKDSADRKDLDYSAWSDEDVYKFCCAAHQSGAGWIVAMTDHHLYETYQRTLEIQGRTVFAPLPFYAPGSRCRLAGDGPSSWTTWIMTARTKAECRWGTLPGGYVRGTGWDAPEKMGGKPVRLMEAIISDYTKTNQVVCDPCMGSGTTGIAAINLGRRFVGIEIDPEEFDRACERIDQAQRQQRLFA